MYRNGIKIRERVRWLRGDLDNSLSETKEKELSMVGVFFEGILGDAIVEEDFKAVCSLIILSEKKIANTCASD